MNKDIHPKVKAGTLAGAISVIVLYVASLFGVELPAGIDGAITVLVSAASGYIKTAP